MPLDDTDLRYFDAKFGALDSRITELKTDHKDRLDYHEELLVGNGTPGVLSRLHSIEKGRKTEKRDRLTLTGISTMVGGFVGGLIAGVLGGRQG